MSKFYRLKIAGKHQKLKRIINFRIETGFKTKKLEREHINENFGKKTSEPSDLEVLENKKMLNQ